MKQFLVVLLWFLGAELVVGQITEKLEHCNCTQTIEQLMPSPEGKFEKTCSGKVIEKGVFKNGKKDGEWVTYSKKGMLLKKVHYTDGQLNGTCEMFFATGTPKLTAFFVNGIKSGKWTYFTSKGKLFMEGEYEVGKPVKIWTINDQKGKTPFVQYDFTAGKYLTNQPVSLHKDNAILQSDNVDAYYILRYPKRPSATGTAPLGGFLLASDLFVDLVEIPVEFWDTYVNYKYKANFTITPENQATLTVQPLSQHMDESLPIYPFIIKTNPDNKLKKINHTPLSNMFLDTMIWETLQMLPPWIYKDKSEIDVYVPYVINQIEGY